MYIVMQDTRFGSPDGFLMKRYYVGETYYMPDSLAYSFIRDGRARNATLEEITQLLMKEVA